MRTNVGPIVRFWYHPGAYLGGPLRLGPLWCEKFFRRFITNELKIMNLCCVNKLKYTVYLPQN